MRAHPHAEATYEIVALETSGFIVKVSIPDTSPTTVSGFETAAAAEAWITQHKAHVQTNARPGMFFGRSRSTRT